MLRRLGGLDQRGPVGGILDLGLILFLTLLMGHFRVVSLLTLLMGLFRTVSLNRIHSWFRKLRQRLGLISLFFQLGAETLLRVLQIQSQITGKF